MIPADASAYLFHRTAISRGLELVLQHVSIMTRQKSAALMGGDLSLESQGPGGETDSLETSAVTPRAREHQLFPDLVPAAPSAVQASLLTRLTPPARGTLSNGTKSWSESVIPVCGKLRPRREVTRIWHHHVEGGRYVRWRRSLAAQRPPWHRPVSSASSCSLRTPAGDHLHVTSLTSHSPVGRAPQIGIRVRWYRWWWRCLVRSPRCI